MAILAYFENDFPTVVDYALELDRKLPFIHRLRRSHLEPLLERIASDNPSVLYRLFMAYNRPEDEQQMKAYLGRLFYDHGDSVEARVLWEMMQSD